MSLPWIKLFASLPRHTKSMHLDAALGRKRTWSHVVELWLWTSQYEPTGDLSGLTDKMIADVSGWRGNASKFVAALKTAGFIDSELCLVGWDEHQAAHVERAEFVASPAVSTDPADAKEAKRARDRERKARKAEAERSRKVAESAEGRAEVSAESRNGRGTVAEDSASQATFTPVSARAHASEIEIEKEIKTERKEEHSSAVADAVRVTPSRSTPKADATEAAITEVLEYWREVVWLSNPKSEPVVIEGDGSDKRRKRIKARLAEGITVEQLKRAADGALHDDWLMGTNPKSTKSYRGVETVFRDRPKVEELIELADNPPRAKPSSGRIGINDMYGVGKPGAFLSSLEDRL